VKKIYILQREPSENFARIRFLSRVARYCSFVATSLDFVAFKGGLYVCTTLTTLGVWVHPAFFIVTYKFPSNASSCCI